MKKGLTLLSMVAVAGVAGAQVNFNTSYSEDFNGIVAGTGTFSATIGVQSAIPGETAWQGAKIGGTGTTATNMILGDGSGNAGAMYGFRNTGSAEFALGSLASGTNIFGFGVQLINTGANPLATISIAFTQENWRSSTSVVNVVVFSWARSSSSTATASDFLTSTSGFNADTNLDLVGPPFVTTNGALDGNNPVNQAFRSSTLTFTTPLGVGESVFIRWSDANDTGNDAGLAIDNLEITSQAVPEPATMAALGLGAAALLRRRRK